MTSPRHVVLLAAAASPLRRIGGRWCRTDLPEPLPPAPVDDAALWQLLDAELLEWLPGEHRLQIRQVWPSEDGLAYARDLVAGWEIEDDRSWCIMEGLQALVDAGGELPAAVYDEGDLRKLTGRGLAIVAGGRALLTGAGRWCAAAREDRP